MIQIVFDKHKNNLTENFTSENKGNQFNQLADEYDHMDVPNENPNVELIEEATKRAPNNR